MDVGELTSVGNVLRDGLWPDLGMLIRALAWHPYDGVADVIAYDKEDRPHTIRYWYTPEVMVFAPPPAEGDPYAMPLTEAEVLRRLGNQRAVLPPEGEHLYLWRAYADQDVPLPFLLCTPSLGLLPEGTWLHLPVARLTVRLTARCR